MTYRSEKTYGDLKVVQLSDYKWGVVNSDDEIVVPFGKYDWIDGYDSGLARVKIGKASKETSGINKWGIINEKGEEVLPVEYDNIWNFVGKGRYSTRVEKGGKLSSVNFHDLNPSLPEFATDQCGNDYYSDGYDYDEYNHYEEFNGIYGLDDATIYDAFEGDPDNYWNID